MRALASSLILLGSVFALLAGLGQLRFRDVFVRMHVATKPATLGLALVLLGAAIRADGIAPSSKLLLAIGLQFLTAPVAAHLVGRAAHQSGDAEDVGLVVDDLARDEARAADEADPT
jgi:multicomponent Na+:H+ antiporter subunit G